MNMISCLFGGLLIASATAWNTDGERDPGIAPNILTTITVHNQIGFMAEEFLNPYTTSVLRKILEPQYNGSIGRAAAWADAYAHTSEGHFSYFWHWIDTYDSPPEQCGLNYTRDCSDRGCVVSAIANQTQILKGCIEKVKAGTQAVSTNLTCSYALKWVSHFMGDIAQPLHASGRGAGGNLVKVTFGHVPTELHAVSITSTSELVRKVISVLQKKDLADKN